MELLIFIVALFIFLALGVPIAVSLGTCAVVMMLYMNVFDPVVIAQQMVMATNNFALMAIPFFMLAENLWPKVVYQNV